MQFGELSFDDSQFAVPTLPRFASLFLSIFYSRITTVTNYPGNAIYVSEYLFCVSQVVT